MTSQPRASAVTVFVPGPLRLYSGGESELGLEAGKVGDLLSELQRHHPALHGRVCDETGAVRRHINVFVNSDHMRDREGLETPLAAGDVVSILPAVSGG
jgi:MoaD family protein